MHFDFCYHETTIPQVHAERPRAFYIPFPSERFSLEIGASPFVTLLRDWKFSYFPRLPEDIFACPPSKKEKVPFCWQMRGYDKHRYFNFFYPIPFCPPRVLKENPCGLYETSYAVGKIEGRHYIVFEGVDSCLYLFVGEKFVGYTTVSHSQAEFDITGYLCENAENTIRAVVFKWCSGTYLEDQDKLRMTGIFREAYILRREEEHLRDYKIETDVDGENGIIRFRADRSCKLKLCFGGRELAYREGSEAEFRLPGAHLWCAEDPTLYTLIIHAGREYIREYVGIRKIEICGAVFRINGRAVKFRGVNRHSMTKNGYVETIADLRRDLRLMKAHNINAVRTAHYPPHPLFPVLCDMAGIYLMEEADLECHGMQTIHYYGDGTNADRLSESAAWSDVYLHRAERMYERDKNRQSIVMWSLGNEAGWGRNFVSMAGWLHARDSRPLHYEGAWAPGGWRDGGVLDVCSRMYPPVEEMRELLEKGIARPFVLCEYTHAMGNSCGDAKDYWHLIESRKELCGAFVWEWCNHTVLHGKKAFYGGDFGEKEYSRRYEGNFCADGLVDTDRAPHSSLKELAEVYAPARVVLDGGSFRVCNRKDHSSLDDLTCRCVFRRNGETVTEYDVDIASLPAGESRDAGIPLLKAEGYVTVDFVFERRGEYVCSSQIVLSDDYPCPHGKGAACLQKENNCIRASAKTYEACFNENGMLSHFSRSGENMLLEPVSVNVWRAPADNDVCFAEEWAGYRLAYAQFFAEKTEICGQRVIVSGKIVADIVEPLLSVQIEYQLFEDGIGISMLAEKGEWVRHIPRFGFVFHLREDFSGVAYFGRGKGEAYEDKLLSAPVGVYESQADAMYVSYVRPQENGAHCGSRWVSLQAKNEMFSLHSPHDFSFSVSPFSLHDYAAHPFDMKKPGGVFLFADYRMCGVGSGACGPATAEKYLLKEKEMSVRFFLRAARLHNRDAGKTKGGRTDVSESNSRMD